jgi:hypothetical protein
VTKTEAFFNFISPSRLYTGALILFAITSVFVMMIYRKLYVKKRDFFKREKISGELNQWIGEALVEESETVVTITPLLAHMLEVPAHRQFITDSLINVKKNISGAATKNIVAIYEQLGLKSDSLKKLNSWKWHLRSRGIYELYMMGQGDAMQDIYRYTDSDNDTVRMEAQTAIVGFYGFKGLNFLNHLTHTLNDWQQLKLLEQLNKLDPDEMHDLPSWLTSPNNYVKLFALKLTRVYNQYGMHSLVANCLSDPDDHTRNEAIKTLGMISNETTPSILRDHYPCEHPSNKREILKQLSIIGSEQELPFLIEQLGDEDDNIKLEAGRAIAKCSDRGWKNFETEAAENEVLLSISKQIKYELAK